MNRLALLLLAVGFGIGLLVQGCGDDEDGGGSSTTVVETETGGDAGESQPAPLADNGFNPEAIYDRAAPGVVTVISISGQGADPLGGGGAGQGSGFVISKEGEILTNAHVVTVGGQASGGGAVKEAKQVFVEFSDLNRVEAEIVGVDPDADVALIKVDPEGLKVSPVELSDGEGLEVGQPVAAIGSPFGEQQSLSLGVISATDRTIPSLTDFSIDGAIQTDASINPGNSGGPLLDAGAKVIGINQQIESQSGSNAGVGFAVPVNAVSYSLEQLREKGSVDYAYIGVSTQTVYPQLADELGLDAEAGALISEVVEGSPAEEAGLEGGDEEARFQGQQVTRGGDLIVAIDGEDVRSSSDVARLVAAKRPGEKVSFEVLRGDDRQTIEVTLGTRPERASNG